MGSSVIKTMDFVGDGTTKALFLIQGVKQGCNLSPMLFNLFLVDVVNKVHDLRLGIPLGHDIITVISYADDIIAFVKNIEDLKIVLECIYAECSKINMQAGIYILCNHIK